MVQILNDNWQIAIKFNWQLTLYALGFTDNWQKTWLSLILSQKKNCFQNGCYFYFDGVDFYCLTEIELGKRLTKNWNCFFSQVQVSYREDITTSLIRYILICFLTIYALALIIKHFPFCELSFDFFNTAKKWITELLEISWNLFINFSP